MAVNPSTYFVTGASGFIGRRLCAALRAEGHAVRALVRRSSVPYLEHMGVELIIGDLRDPESYRNALRGCAHVIHLGGDPTFSNGAHYHLINYQATVDLIEAIHTAVPGLERFVYVSTMGAVDRTPTDDCSTPLDESSVPHPSTDYGRSKLAAEQAVRSSNIPWSIVRPTLVIGRSMRPDSHVAAFVRHAVRHSLLSRFDFPAKMSLIHVDDLVSALRFCATSNSAIGKTFFAAGEPVTLGSIFRLGGLGRSMISVAWMNILLRPILRFVPFKLKALFFDAMTVSDAALRAAGWQPAHAISDELRAIGQRERFRVDYKNPYTGYTVVTGAASGLGAALSKQLAGLRRRLILVDRDTHRLAKVLPDTEGVIRLTCDLASEEGIEQLLSLPEWDREGVDEVFSCAGIGARGLVTELDLERQLNIFRLNTVSRLILARHAAIRMLERGCGRIVLISSSSAFQALPYMSVYAASNAALLALGEGMWGELRGSGVEVLTVCPGGMMTNFQSSADVRVLPNERLDAPEDVSAHILARLGRNQSVFVTNTRAHMMELMSRMLPTKTRILVWRKLMQKLR